MTTESLPRGLERAINEAAENAAEEVGGSELRQRVLGLQQTSEASVNNTLAYLEREYPHLSDFIQERAYQSFRNEQLAGLPSIANRLRNKEILSRIGGSVLLGMGTILTAGIIGVSAKEGPWEVSGYLIGADVALLYAGINLSSNSAGQGRRAGVIEAEVMQRERTLPNPTDVWIQF